MSPFEAELLAVERRLEAIDRDARTLRRQLAGVQQGVRETWGLVKVSSGHPISACPGKLFGDVLKAADSTWGAFDLVWYPPLNAWKGILTVDFPSCGLTRCAASPGLPITYTFSGGGGLTIAWPTASSTVPCPATGGGVVGGISFAYSAPPACNPFRAVMIFNGGSYTYLYCTTDANAVTVTITEPA